MKLCKDCKHSVQKNDPNGKVRLRCSRIDGSPICINAREEFWNKKGVARECGPNGNLFESK